MTIERFKHIGFYLLSFLLTALVFHEFILAEKLVDIDYGLIRARIEYAGGFLPYYRSSFSVMDVQPVRDIVFSIIITCEKFLGVQLFGFFQVVFWYGAGLFLYHSQRILAVSLRTRLLLTAYFLLHPIASWSLYWPSSLKHTLSLFFISAATYFSFKLKKDLAKKSLHQWLILVTFVLSIFSQPISILWLMFFVCLFYDDLKEGSYRELFIIAGLAAVVCLGCNFFYYSHVYPLQTGVDKMVQKSTLNVPIAIAAFSRSYYQLLLPTSFGFEYSILSWQNYIGLPAFAVVMFFLKMRLGVRKALLAFIVISHPFFIIYSKSTNIFVSDTYLLISLWGLALSLSLLVNTLKSKIVTTGISILVVSLAVKTYTENKNTVDPLRLFQVTLEREPSCKSALFFANHLYQNKLFDQFMSAAGSALKNKCLVKGFTADQLVSRIYALFIYSSKDLSLENKKEIFESLNKHDPLIGRLRAQILPNSSDTTSLQNYYELIDWDQFIIDLNKWMKETTSS